MTAESLAGKLLQQPKFSQLLDAVVVDSVASQFSALTRSETVQATHDWRHLLACASILARANDAVSEDAALRIAQHCLVASNSDDYQDAAGVVLDKLTNRPSLALAESRKHIAPSLYGRLPLHAKLEWTRREFEFSVPLGNEQEILLNRFQKKLWDASDDAKLLSVSAPTSTGKSFVLCHWLAEYLRKNSTAFVVYVVPTRALIQQVESDLRDHFAVSGLSRVNVSSLPIATALKPERSNVLVLTQERLHILLNGLTPAAYPNLLLIDEAQKVADGARGILLENVVDLVLVRSSGVRAFFASPMVSNPELLLRGRGNQGAGTVALSSNHVTVNQNLLWVCQVPRKPQQWQVELCVRDKMLAIGTIELPFRPTSESKRLTFVAHTLADQVGGNLVYVNGAADAEKAALQMWDLLSPEFKEKSTDPELAQLIELVKKVVHPQYALASVLERGVGFHYGNMPLLIRSEVERLFKSNKIRFLICTSTLIEGVNLPCKSIFVRGPQKGRGKPMNETDFWNLAGRAGRLGKEFQGNVFCVDARRPDVWKESPPTQRGRYAIRRAADAVFEGIDDFLKYVADGTPADVSRERPEFDQVLSYLLSQFSDSDGLKKCPGCSGLPEGVLSRIETAVSEVRTDLLAVMEVVERNPGISPFAMQRLLKYFAEREKPIEELVPVQPESEDSAEVYNKIFQRINSHLADVFGRRTFGLAILVVHWMRGYPLARIIVERINYLKKQENPPDLAAIIRQVMDDVEQVARFLAPKFLSCYIDLLKIHLNEKGRSDLSAALPDVNIWLEFGASQRTQLSLMGLGLSRTTAIAISEFIADDSLSEEDVLAKLTQFNLASLNLPVAILKELQNLLGVKQ